MTKISSSASGCRPVFTFRACGKGADIPARGGSRARERVRELVDGRPRVHRTRTVASFVELAGGHFSHAPVGRLAALPAGIPFFRYDAGGPISAFGRPMDPTRRPDADAPPDAPADAVIRCAASDSFPD